MPRQYQPLARQKDRNTESRKCQAWRVADDTLAQFELKPALNGELPESLLLCSHGTSLLCSLYYQPLRFIRQEYCRIGACSESAWFYPDRASRRDRHHRIAREHYPRELEQCAAKGEDCTGKSRPRSIRNAIALLENDTNMWPGHQTIGNVQSGVSAMKCGISIRRARGLFPPTAVTRIGMART